MTRKSTFFLLLLTIGLASCGSYKQNIMFKVPHEQALKQQVQLAEQNYLIAKNDLLKMLVYTKNGELIVDPDYQLFKEIPVQAGTLKPNLEYLVDINGIVKFPMLGEVKVEGLTLRQAEAILQKEYARYYEDSFVRLEYLNKRVIVLGASGGKVIPLVNQNVSLAEVLALASGIHNDAKATNIRVIRNDQIFVVDFSTFEGYTRTNMLIQPGDIVYIEPIRRPASEALRDYYPLFSVLTGVTTLLVVLFGI